MADQGPMYGLDAQLKAKRDAKYSVEEEQKVVAWMEELTGLSKGDKAFGEWLKDGTVLCATLNGIKAKTVKKPKASTMPFKQMEAIKTFLQGCRTLGMAEHDVFCTPDLFEEKDLGAVVRSLVALSSTAQTKVPGYSGPTLGVKQSSANARAGADWKGKELGTGGEVSMLNQGSRGVMEKQGPSVRAREVAGHEAAGSGSNVATKMSQGSRGVMQATTTADVRSPTFGADAAKGKYA